jgi:hypothetical protein
MHGLTTIKAINAWAAERAAKFAKASKVITKPKTLVLPKGVRAAVGLFVISAMCSGCMHLPSAKQVVPTATQVQSILPSTAPVVQPTPVAREPLHARVARHVDEFFSAPVPAPSTPQVVVPAAVTHPVVGSTAPATSPVTSPAAAPVVKVQSQSKAAIQHVVNWAAILFVLGGLGLCAFGGLAVSGGRYLAGAKLIAAGVLLPIFGIWFAYHWLLVVILTLIGAACLLLVTHWAVVAPVVSKIDTEVMPCVENFFEGIARRVEKLEQKVVDRVDPPHTPATPVSFPPGIVGTVGTDPTPHTTGGLGDLVQGAITPNVSGTGSAGPATKWEVTPPVTTVGSAGAV